jgi:hypothetical protein
MSQMAEVPRPPAHRSPLEHEVANLRRLGRDTAALDRGWFADIALIVVDAVVARDKRALDAVDDLVRDVHRQVVLARDELAGHPGAHHPEQAERLSSCASWVQLTADSVRCALDRVNPAAAAVRVRGTVRERFLRIVADRPGINSRSIRALINEVDAAVSDSRTADSGTADTQSADTPAAGTRAAGSRAEGARPMDEGQLSRIGQSLRAEGYVFAERGARGLSWELTPRGEELLGHLPGEEGRPRAYGNGMVVTTGQVAPVAVAGLVREDLPRVVSFVRARDTLKYRRAGRAEPREDETAPLDLVIKGLLADHAREVPGRFRVDDSLYVRTA